MILGDPILYRDDIIYFKIKPVKIVVKRQEIVIFFNVLPLDKDKAVLGMPFLWKFNPKIDWIIKTVEVRNT